MSKVNKSEKLVQMCVISFRTFEQRARACADNKFKDIKNYARFHLP